MTYSLRQTLQKLNDIALPIKRTTESVTAVRVIVNGKIYDIETIQHNQYLDSDFRVDVVHFIAHREPRS